MRQGARTRDHSDLSATTALQVAGRYEGSAFSPEADRLAHDQQGDHDGYQGCRPKLESKRPRRSSAHRDRHVALGWAFGAGCTEGADSTRFAPVGSYETAEPRGFCRLCVLT